MADLIDRGKFIMNMQPWLDIECYNDGERNMLKCILSELAAVPSVQPERHGFSVIDIKTGEEADQYEIALHEEWAKQLIYCDMEGFAIEEDGSLILVDECGRYEYCPIGRFEVRWS